MNNWNNTRLKNLLKEPLAYGLNVSSELDDHNMPRYIRITDFDDFNNLNEQTFKSLPIEIAQGALLKDGDLLFARSGASVGKTYLYQPLPNGACYAGYLIKARFNKHVVNPKYVYYFTKSQEYENWKNSTYIQATIQNISAEKYYQLPIFLPSIEEQDKMVSYLDTKLSEIDHQVSLLTSKRDAYLRLKKSVISRAVTKGLNPNVKMKDSGVEWIGEVPEGWKAQKLKRVALIQTGNTPSTDVKRYWENGTIDWYTPGDFNEEHTCLGSSLRKISAKAIEEKEVKNFPCNTVLLVGIGATLGKVALSPKGCSANQQINGIIFKDCMLPQYGTYLLFSARNYIRSLSNSATLPILNKMITGEIQICTPPLSEQRAIAAYLDDKCSKIDRIISNLDKQISKYGALKRSLIDEVITGKRAI